MLVTKHPLGRSMYIGRNTCVLINRIAADHQSVELVVTTDDAVTHESEGARAHKMKQGQRALEGVTGRSDTHELTVSLRAGLFIGKGTRITVEEINDGLVSIGFTAPPDTAFSRDDISYEKHLEYQGRRERGERQFRH